MALFNTEITGEVPDLSGLQSLEVFKVENCKLAGEGFMSLYNIPSLIILGVSGNDDITGTLDGIEKLVNLQELYLAGTKMNGPLPEAMGDMTKLKFIQCEFIFCLCQLHEPQLLYSSPLSYVYSSGDFVYRCYTGNFW